MSDWADVVAEVVLRKFGQLPAKAKPRKYPNGKREWVPLCGIVFSKGDEKEPTCVSIGTGMRCLPVSKIPHANGRCLHDWHAEIVALRALNLFLIEQCASLASPSAPPSRWVRRRTNLEITSESFQPFALQEGVNIDMYSSEAPCGDASMELVMDAQSDPTPWHRDSEASLLSGRGFFSELGIVRKKPARGDAPDTLSKSCSDKLALKQCASLLGSIPSLLIHPGGIYLRHFVIPANRYFDLAIERAFSQHGRMAVTEHSASDSDIWKGGYNFLPFNVIKSTKVFDFSRDGVDPAQLAGGSNIAAMWIPGHQEVLIGGTVQGHKQFSVSGASALCRARIWDSARLVADAIAMSEISQLLQHDNYAKVKQGNLLAQRQKVKDHVRHTALKNWARNDGDSTFQLLT